MSDKLGKKLPLQNHSGLKANTLHDTPRGLKSRSPRRQRLPTMDCGVVATLRTCNTRQTTSFACLLSNAGASTDAQ